MANNNEQFKAFHDAIKLVKHVRRLCEQIAKHYVTR